MQRNTAIDNLFYNILLNVQDLQVKQQDHK